MLFRIPPTIFHVSVRIGLPDKGSHAMMQPSSGRVMIRRRWRRESVAAAWRELLTPGAARLFFFLFSLIFIR